MPILGAGPGPPITPHGLGPCPRWDGSDLTRPPWFRCSTKHRSTRDPQIHLGWAPETTGERPGDTDLQSSHCPDTHLQAILLPAHSRQVPEEEGYGFRSEGSNFLTVCKTFWPPLHLLFIDSANKHWGRPCHMPSPVLDSGGWLLPSWKL